ncbi:MAG: DUF6754 domain-containing protein, partial [bacterium]
MTKTWLKVCSLSLVVCGLLTLKGVGSEQEPIKILTFTGESVPGVFTLMDLVWTLNQTEPDDIRYRLLRLGLKGDTLMKIDLPAGTHHYEDQISAGQWTHRYRLEVWREDFLLDQREIDGLVAHQGGFFNVRGEDIPHDGGGEIRLLWEWNLPNIYPEEIKVYRHQPGQERWVFVGAVNQGKSEFVDIGTKDGVPYDYLLRAYTPGYIWESAPIMGVVSRASWMDMRKINLLIIALIVIGAVLYYIYRTGKKPMFIRKIAGLEAIEEAVGRATEMGRSVLFVPGIQDLDDVQTLAGLTILGSVARLTARYETKLNVPVSRSLVMSNGREVVKEAYMAEGRPDIYHSDIVHYVTDEQFGYVAAVDGIMVREKPAACLYLGAFFAESLILAETGNSVGAI